MISMRNIAAATLAVGWLMAAGAAHACDDGPTRSCTYPVTATDNKAEGDKKADNKQANGEPRRRSGRAASRSARHRSAYRSGRRLARTSRRSRARAHRIALRAAREEAQDNSRIATRDDTGQAPVVDADEAVQVLPQAMETGTSLAPVPATPIGSALRFPLGPATAAAMPLPNGQPAPAVTLPAPMQVADAGPQPAPPAPAAAPRAQSANVGQAAAPASEHSDTMLLRAMFLTLAGALTLATAARLVIG